MLLLTVCYTTQPTQQQERKKQKKSIQDGEVVELSAMKFLLILLSIIPAALSQCGSSQTMLNEGAKLCCYYDTTGIPTIGYGFNLNGTDASSTLSQYGLTLANVLNDCKKSTSKSCLTQAQIEAIFNSKSYPEATTCVNSFVSGLSAQVQAALIDVAFAGCATLNQFVKMKADLQNKDYTGAANELKNSAWCVQVKQTRCSSDAACILSGGSGSQLQYNLYFEGQLSS
ncbi:unnamed protein product [Didymodactylos carnosus]|uniref:Uncharacterized protein n=1 Tax=Didymodactylos carnosus TaxID=1234261 RepID=A0A8S2FFM3_9BILA|nr:unnamed protein product [Didymodactylos carnosus]CAF4248900.1 unnamed protein product [Didymodactylos carnosus]